MKGAMKNPLETPQKNTHAVALGKLGGKAGTGAVKRRGDSGYYTRLAQLAAIKRKKPLTKSIT